MNPPLSSGLFRELRSYFFEFREASLRELGEYELPVEAYFETSPVRRRQRQTVLVLLEQRKELFRQTDGAGFVASGSAVDDLDLHVALLAKRWSCERRRRCQGGERPFCEASGRPGSGRRAAVTSGNHHMTWDDAAPG